MSFDLSTAQRLVLKALASEASGRNISVTDLETNVASFYASEQHIKIAPGGDWRNIIGSDGESIVHEVLWDCIIQRILTVGQSGNWSWAFVKLTEYGREVVKEQHWSPYDPNGYLRELDNQAGRLAKLCNMYIAEALTSFRGGAYLATAVMLGAASEGNMVDLFDRYHGAMDKGGVAEHSGYQDKLRKAHSFFEKYKVFRRYFDPVKTKLPGRLVEDLDGQMDGVLHLIRNYRNDAGHPTKTKIERMAAFRSLVLFVPYSQRIEQVGDWLESNSDKLQP